MRILTWITALSSVMLLLAAGRTSAQSPDQTVTSASFDDALTGRVTLTSFSDASPSKTEIRGQSMGYGGYPGAGGFQPAYTNNNPAALWPANTPQGFQPDPAISPFYPTSVTQQTTYNRNGLWFKDILYRNRDYFFDLEYIYTNYRGPGNAPIGERPLPVSPIDNNVIGFPISNFGLGGFPASFGPAGQTGDAGTNSGGFGGVQRVVVGPGIIPFALLPNEDASDATYATVPGAFPHRDMTIFRDLNTHGIRSRWGFMDERGTGMMLTGFWGGEASDIVEFGYTHWNGIPVTQDLIIANSGTDGGGGGGAIGGNNTAQGGVPVSALFGSIPLEFAEGFIVPVNGEDIYGFTGTSQKFDTFFQIATETSAVGGGLNLYHEPVYRRKWVTVRPTYGARYLYMDDRFRFRGIDSGLSYQLDDTTGGAGGGGGAQQGAGTASTFRPTTAVIPTDADGNIVDLFLDARLKSNVDSHMAGPEAGIRYDFGTSKNFAIWGQSTFGLLANHERVRITGENIGDPVAFLLLTGDNFLVDDPTDNDDVFDTRFDNSATHTHASPLFEQSIIVEANVLKYVPIIRDFHLLEQAQFQAGYTLTVIGNVARAGDSIRWKAFPETPHPEIDYQTWSMQNWSLAVHWDF